MDYKEKYEQALSRAKTVITLTSSDEAVGAAITIFPELRESEDERIRKALLELVRQSSEVLDKQNQNNMIAWLEKQGEKTFVTTPQWMIDFLDDLRTKIGCTLNYDENKEIEGKILGVIKWLKHDEEYIEELEKMEKFFGNVEELTIEKSSWSEEDKKMLISALWHVSNSASNGKSTDYQCEVTDWLKSLKPRWKPTEEQMEHLNRCFTGRILPDADVLESLYNDLKSL